MRHEVIIYPIQKGNIFHTFNNNIYKVWHSYFKKRLSFKNINSLKSSKNTIRFRFPVQIPRPIRNIVKFPTPRKNLESNSQGLPGGGMLKFRIDRYIILNILTPILTSLCCTSVQCCTNFTCTKLLKHYYCRIPKLNALTDEQFFLDKFYLLFYLLFADYNVGF